MPQIIERVPDTRLMATLEAAGYPPIMARIFASRGLASVAELATDWHMLLSPSELKNTDHMAVILANAIQTGKKILVVGDYDADGATATALAVRALRSMGACVDFLVPNRFEYGYGLTPEIVDQAAKQSPDFIITVDNGIASVPGIARANSLGMQVLVTDHHLPGAVRPDAASIVNPNQHGCDFPSKHLAGVGVIFYVMLALRAELRNRRFFIPENEPKLAELLDLVALGTVADLVRLDHNNRILVEHGLRRIRAGRCNLGIQALAAVSGRDLSRLNSQDLAFYLGPRLNAAGRLDDMQIGIRCLLSDNASEAHQLALQLQQQNQDRRDIENTMQVSAQALLDDLQADERVAISLYDPSWHQGVIGILASRIKEKLHRPVIAFAPAGESADGKPILKGSGRSIRHLHLRDALDMLSKHEPEILLTFGGHAMAAGLSILTQDFNRFAHAFDAVVRSLTTPEMLQSQLEVDGSLAPDECTLSLAETIQQQVWGQGFAEPLFYDSFHVLEQTVIAEKHSRLRLQQEHIRGQSKPADTVTAMLFQHTEPLPNKIRAVYQLSINSFRQQNSLQLILREVLP